MSYYDTQRQLKSYWRQPGNPRLKGLLLAALPNTNYTAEEIGRAWVTETDGGGGASFRVELPLHEAVPTTT